MCFCDVCVCVCVQAHVCVCVLYVFKAYKIDYYVSMGLLFLKVLNFEICIYFISFYTCKRFVCVDVHHMCAYVFRVQERIMNPMELELQMIDSLEQN